VIEHSIIKNWFSCTAEEITVPGITSSWIRLRAWSENRPESFAGVHCDAPFFLFDEASGISQAIFEAAAGSMMHPHSKQLLLGNPIWRRGELFEAFHSKRSSFTCMTVGAEDSTFIDPEWVHEMEAQYGKDSDVVRVRVRGLFPNQDVDGFLSESDILSTKDRVVHIQHAEPVVGGLDIGKYRDASVLVLRQGSKVIHKENFRTRNTLNVAQLVYELILKYKVYMIAVDANGVGTGCYERLEQLCGDHVMRVKQANLPIATEKEFFNNRAKLWGKAKKWMKTGSIPAAYVDELAKQGSSLLFSYDAHGRIVLETKKEAVKRGIGSPDDFDALTYSFAVPVTAAALKSAEDMKYDATQNEIDITWY